MLKSVLMVAGAPLPAAQVKLKVVSALTSLETANLDSVSQVQLSNVKGLEGLLYFSSIAGLVSRKLYHQVLVLPRYLQAMVSLRPVNMHNSN